MVKKQYTLDGVVKTSIYCVECPVAIRGHTICIVKTRTSRRTLLLGVYAPLRLPVSLCFYLAIFEYCLDFYEFITLDRKDFFRGCQDNAYHL